MSAEQLGDADTGAPTGEGRAPQDLPTLCILAGGLGTRLGEIAKTTPKPLVEVAGQPFLAHQLRLLAEHGARRAVLCVGHLGQSIEDVIGGNCAGVELAYSYDSPGLDGTLGAIRRARPLLGERFLVLYGDTYLRIDYRDVVEDWTASGAPAVMTVLCNEGRWDRSNTLFEDGYVVSYDKHHPTPEMVWIDYGLGGLTTHALELAEPDMTDLSELYAMLAPRHLLRGYEATERFYEIGSPQALEETDRFLRARRIART
jgi:NDP-sugar pyrophosphorylase family protein